MVQVLPDARSELLFVGANHVVAAKRISPRLHEVLSSKSRTKSMKYSEANRQSKTQLTQFAAFALTPDRVTSKFTVYTVALPPNRREADLLPNYPFRLHLLPKHRFVL